MDELDKKLLAALQGDAGQSYAALAGAVGLSAAATHDRVRKLRESGLIRRTTIEVDPAALGRGVLAYVLVESGSWMGDEPTKDAVAGITQVEEAHVIAGPATLLLKVRTGATEELQAVLRALHGIDGVKGTQTIVVLESFFERPTQVS